MCCVPLVGVCVWAASQRRTRSADIGGRSGRSSPFFGVEAVEDDLDGGLPWLWDCPSAWVSIRRPGGPPPLSPCLGGIASARGEVRFECGELYHSERDGRDRGDEEKRSILVA